MGISSETRPKSWLHGMVAAHAGARLAQYVEEHGLGSTYMLTGSTWERSRATSRRPTFRSSIVIGCRWMMRMTDTSPARRISRSR
jgi:hypothetical protein